MHKSWGDVPLFNGDLPQFFRKRPVTTTARPEIQIFDVVHAILWKNYGRFKGGTKILAIHARSTPRTAENWLQKTCTPNAQNLFNIMQHCDELCDTFVRLAKEDP